MTTKEPFLRRCSECHNATVIVNKDDEEAECPVCDTNHTVEWTPRIHAITKKPYQFQRREDPFVEKIK